MKALIYIVLCSGICLAGCKKNIEQSPQSNLSTATYYSNLTEVQAGLTGCYNGLQAPLVNEWRVTELRSDNSKQGSTGSTGTDNYDLNELDMFAVSTSHPSVLAYWLSTYANIRNANVLLQKLGVVYNPSAGSIGFNNIDIPITDVDRKQAAGEALFIRAYHYFNLVRLFGGVFLIHEPIGPNEALTINRSSVADVYKFIESDLNTAITSTSTAKYSQITATNLGRANSWAAKALLAKVYLTQGKKTEAASLLQDIIANSGYSLQSTYATVFSTTAEVNSEILFTVRYKAGGLGLGSPFANYFAPSLSGSAVVLGDGKGWNYPTAELDTLTNTDNRKSVLIGVYVNGTSKQLYPKKFLSTVAIVNDAENDWPVLRYADVLLMLAEAQGLSQSSIDMINLVRVRAGMAAYGSGAITTTAQFEQALANERRIEFAFENQRWFDLVRFNTTLTTITAEQTMKDHFAKEFAAHYFLYPSPKPTLAQLQANVTKDHLLLPIPQREIDTNTQLVIPQNPGY